LKHAFKRQKHQNGFTMVELITVMVLLGVLAAIAIPKLMGENVTEAAVYGDKVVSALRLAQKSAVAKRRVVCLPTASGTLRVSRNPGSSDCEDTIEGAANLFANQDAGIGMSGAPPELRFQPDGSILDGDNAQRSEIRIAITLSGKVQRTIRLDGGTGHVD
jgi:MSHA pilin protein MshC